MIPSPGAGSSFLLDMENGLTGLSESWRIPSATVTTPLSCYDD
jgi:hypothetical protein